MKDFFIDFYILRFSIKISYSVKIEPTEQKLDFSGSGLKDCI